MADKARRRKVILSPAAIKDMREIWEWNSERYGTRHADAYRRFLEDLLDSLADPKTAGNPAL